MKNKMEDLEKQFLKKLNENNIIWVKPDNANIIKQKSLEDILKLIGDIGTKYKNESFNMMPLIENIELITNEVTNAISVVDFMFGKFNLYGIFLYDYTKHKPEFIKSVLKQYFINPSQN